MDKLRSIVNRDGTYYPVVKGSDNPYRDGYVKEPPKKPRASYLFFQNAMRSYYQKKNPAATQAELMKILGEAWGNMSDEERSPFLELAQEEAQQYDKEKVLLEKAQKPNEVWQPMRRCLLVLERLAKDSFADIFLEPVDMEEFPDYEEFIDSPMDLGTIRTRLQQKKYQAPEQFARDMRRVSLDQLHIQHFASLPSVLLTHCLPSSCRYGTIVRFTTSTARPSGTLQTTCQSSLSVCIMLGFLNSVSDTFVGPIRVRGHGSTHVVNTMESVVLPTIKWSSVTTAMPCTVSSASPLR